MPWVDVAAADLQDGVHRGELNDGRGVVLVRRGAQWWALRDTCPHQGARLSHGAVSGRVPPCRPGADIDMIEDEPVLVCPWHGWEFDVESGRCLTDPERQRVRAYEVKVESGRVWLKA